MHFVKIKAGAFIHHDRAFGYWPSTAGGSSADPETVFMAERHGDGWLCRARGFGLLSSELLDDYGSGAIYVERQDGVMTVFETAAALPTSKP